MIPVGQARAIAKVDDVINVVKAGTSSGLLNKIIGLSGFGAKSAVTGVEFGSRRLAQTGEVEEGKEGFKFGLAVPSMGVGLKAGAHLLTSFASIITGKSREVVQLLLKLHLLL